MLKCARVCVYSLSRAYFCVCAFSKLKNKGNTTKFNLNKGIFFLDDSTVFNCGFFLDIVEKKLRSWTNKGQHQKLDPIFKNKEQKESEMVN